MKIKERKKTEKQKRHKKSFSREFVELVLGV